MRSSSKYFPLKFLIECKRRGSPRFDPIAAFDSEVIAKNYADDCKRTNTFNCDYRVMERKGNGSYIQIYDPAP